MHTSAWISGRTLRGSGSTYAVSPDKISTAKSRAAVNVELVLLYRHIGGRTYRDIFRGAACCLREKDSLDSVASIGSSCTGSCGRRAGVRQGGERPRCSCSGRRWRAVPGRTCRCSSSGVAQHKNPGPLRPGIFSTCRTPGGSAVGFGPGKPVLSLKLRSRLVCSLQQLLYIMKGSFAVSGDGIIKSFGKGSLR